MAIKQLIHGIKDFDEGLIQDFLKEIKLLRLVFHLSFPSPSPSPLPLSPSPLSLSVPANIYAKLLILLPPFPSSLPHSAVRHKNLVEFYGISFPQPNELYLVMELMERGTVRDILDTKGDNLTLNYRIGFLIDTARAMFLLFFYSFLLFYLFIYLFILPPLSPSPPPLLPSP